jgi:GT2 family glycosyltransferase
MSGLDALGADLPSATPGVALPFVSVIVPCRNEAGFIARCMDSILATEYPHDRVEVVVVDGRSDDGTREILADYQQRSSLIRVLDNAARITPTALNIAVRAARGEVIARLDAHASYPSVYLPRLVAALEESGADSVGGVIVTLPADDSPASQAIAIGMSHPFGVGNSRFRIGTMTRRAVDHVPFFCCRREVFDRVGLFDEELVRNQDGEFSSRVIRSGGKILLVPDVHSFYYARNSLAKLVRTFYQYGYFKPLSARKVGRVMTVRQLVPSTFLLALIASATLSPVVPVAGTILTLIAGLYATAVIGCVVHASIGRSARCVLPLMAVFPLMHFSYAVGYLRRTLELAFWPVGRARIPSPMSLSR